MPKTSASKTYEFSFANGKSKLLVPLLAAFVVAELKFFFFFSFQLLTKIKSSFMTKVNFEANSNMNCPQIEWLCKQTY